MTKDNSFQQLLASATAKVKADSRAVNNTAPNNNKPHQNGAQDNYRGAFEARLATQR